MRTIKKEVTMILAAGLVLQGCMVTTPDYAACSAHNLHNNPAPTVNPLAHSGHTPQQTPLSPSAMSPVVRTHSTSRKTQFDLPSFLLNNVTQLLLVCAQTGKC